MNMKKKHQRTIKELSTKAANIKSEIKKLILDLPQNSAINEFGHNCFTIKTSKLLPGLVFSPQTYDFRFQYKEICDIIDDTPIENIYDKLKEILKTNTHGECWVYEKNKNRTLFHPEVVNNIKEILGL